MTTRTIAIILAAALAAVGARAEMLDETDVRAAAVAFVNRDTIGASVLAGRQVASVTARDALWVVRLSPSGYIVFSGDTAAEPVVAFSANDYVEPPDDSPFEALLALANTNAMAVGTQTTIRRALYATSSTTVAAARTSSSTQASRRAAKWAALLGETDETRETTRGGISLLMAASGSTSSQSRRVEPFLSTTWSQNQPYNDFAFIDPAEASTDDSYRRRYPCGCVATAYAQVMKYWAWPTRTDEAMTYDHLTKNSEEGEKWRRLRFDGHASFEWSGMADSSKWYTTTPQHESLYDLRGNVAESNRFATARLLLYVDVLSAMNFATGGSSTHFYYAKIRDKWYEFGEYAARGYDAYENNDAAFFEAIYSDLSNGIPVLVNIPGHAIVAHGWQVDEDNTQFVYLNYGWNGQNDGWFNTTETDSVTCEKGYVQEAFLRHIPVLTAQIDPLTGVSETNVTVRWSVPEKRAKGLRCQLKVREYRDDYSTWTEDFSSTTQISTDTNRIYVGTTSHTDGKGLVIVSPAIDAAFDIMPVVRILSDQSELSYRVRASWATNLFVRIQASYDGGNDWKTIDTVPVGTGSEIVDWTTRTVDLKEHAGERILLRVKATTTDTYYPKSSESDPCGIQLDDFQITNIREFDEKTYVADPDVRDLQVRSLTPGAECSFTVTPISEEKAVESAAVWTRIAADGEAATTLPAIKSVRSVSAASSRVQEGFYRECARGTNLFFVTCSTNTTSLKAYASHVTLVPIGRVDVSSLGNGQFVVTVDGGAIPENMDRSRMILTLVATDAEGVAAYKDLSLRFSSETSVDAPYAPETYTTAAPIPVTREWLRKYELVPTDATEAEINEAAKADVDGDGHSAYAEYLCGTDPTNRDDVFKIFIEMVDGDPVISWTPTNAAANYFVQGVTNLVDETWIDTNAVNRAGLRFFRVRVEPK